MNKEMRNMYEEEQNDLKREEKTSEPMRDIYKEIAIEKGRNKLPAT